MDRDPPVPDDDDDVWVVTDALEEALGDDNGVMEEEYDYEADEDDQYSHTSYKDGSLFEKIDENADDHPEQEIENIDNSDTPNDSTNCDKEENSLVTENNTLGQDNNGNKDNGKKETGDHNEESATKEKEENPAEENTSNVSKDPEEKNKSKVERNPVKDLANKIKDSCSTHKDKVTSYSTLREANVMKNKSLFANGPKTHVVFSEELVRLTKDHIKQSIKLDKELHESRMKHEFARHRAELEVLRFQLSYWKKKLKH